MLTHDEQDLAQGAPVSSPEISALERKLELLQQISDLENSTNPRPLRSQPVISVKIPEGSYHMSLTEFRTYKKDRISYQVLTKCTDAQVVLQLRMHMDVDLKRVIDANHPEWDTLTAERASKQSSCLP